MTEILMVRHAQASYGKANYDALSEMGHEQARRLGTWLADHYDGFDLVVTGAMVRHRETLHAIAETYRARDRALMHPEEDATFNEFDHKAVLDAFQARHAAHPAAVAMRERADDPRTIYGFLRAGMDCWARGELDDALDEGWSPFSSRVAQGVAALATRCSELRRVLVVTSGGVIAQVARLALGLAPERVIDLNLSIRNSSISEFHGAGAQLRFGSWNTLPHLAAADSRAMWTHY